MTEKANSKKDISIITVFINKRLACVILIVTNALKNLDRAAITVRNLYFYGDIEFYT